MLALLFAIPIAIAACDSSAPTDVAEETLTLNTTLLELEAGDTARLRASRKNGVTNITLSESVNWTSSDTSIASVDGTGLVTARKEGEASVAASTRLGKSSARVKISKPRRRSVTISPQESTLQPGDSLQLSVTVVRPRGDTVSAKVADVQWASLDSKIASVDSKGMVISKAVGLALITATSGPVTDTARVQVVSDAGAAIESVVVTPTADTVAVTDSVELVASALTADGDTLTDVPFTWESSDPAVATVYQGMVTPQAEGTATITANAGGEKARASIKVRPSDPLESSDPTEPTPSASGPVRAFPGAEGYGAVSVGGRGGEVYFVTHTNDGGRGSLRECVEASGPRICIFRTGGTITLSGNLTIQNPYITIAGQTAPGGGIQIRGDGRAMTIFKIETHDVVIRYVRARPGKGAETCGRDGNTKCQRDAITLTGNAQNVVLDHVTAMFGNDEQISGKVSSSGDRIKNVTIQHSLLGNVFNVHPTSGIWSSKYNRTDVQNISIHNNLFANSGHRTPLVGRSLRVEAINNVIYNWDGKSAMANGNGQPDIIASYYKAGPTTKDDDNLLQINNPDGDLSVYIEGIVADPAKPSAGTNDWEFVENREGSQLSASYRRSTPHSRGPEPARFPVTVSSAQEAYRNLVVEGDVGAWRRLTCDGSWTEVRDELDRQTLQDVRNGTQGGRMTRGWPDNENGYGGFPRIASGTACADKDSDGMPDEFEARFNFDSNDPADAGRDANGNGYSNLEEYLNGTDPR